MTDQQLIIKVKAETDKAVKQVNLLTKEVSKLTKENDRLGKTKGVDSLSKGFSGLTKTLGGVIVGFGALGVAMKAVDFEKVAADAEQSADAFEKVFTDLGFNAEEEFNRIKEASLGLISEQAIRQSAVTAASLGVPVAKLAELMEVARAKSREMGTDVKSAFNDLATGIGRGSPMILDNLGLTIKIGDANLKYAESIGKTVEQLSKQDKAMALTNAVIESGASSVDRFADSGLSAVEQTQKLNAKLDDLKVIVGKQLLEPMNELTKSTIAWLDTINEADIDKYTGKLERLWKALKNINDVGAPDIAFGEDVGVMDAAFERLVNLTKILGVMVDTVDNAVFAQDELFEQVYLYESLAKAVREFTGTSDDFDRLERSMRKSIEEASALHVEWSGSNSEQYKKKLVELDKVLKGLGDEYSNLLLKKPFEPTIESADLAKKAVEDYYKGMADLDEASHKKLKSSNSEQLSDAKRTYSKLLSERKKLNSDIEKADKDLAKELAKIEEDRFKSNYDANQQIKDLEISLLPEFQQYAENEKREAQALADAKLAIKQGELDKSKIYLDEYERLANESSGRIAQGAGSIAATEQQTIQEKIRILKQVQQIENDGYAKQEQIARDLHNATIEQKKAELEATKQLLIAQKTQIDNMKILVELLTGKTVELDTSAIDTAIHKISATQTLLGSLTRDKKELALGSNDIDTANTKVQELKRITLNGITLDVKADTTPADFDIKKLITKESKDGITMDINPEYEDAQKKLDNLRAEEAKKPIEKKLDLDAGAAKKVFDDFVERTRKPSVHTIKADASQPNQVISVLKKPTSSVHTVYVKEVHTRANGGLIPQKLATGGTFMGTGKVPGYDSTDSDKVNAKLTGGEFVVKRSAVDAYGTSLLHSINNMSLPKFANGGEVGGSSSSGELQPVNLNIGGQSFNMMSDRDVVEALQRFIDSEGGL